MMGFQPDTRLIRLFVNWIEQFDPQHARNWGRLYRNDAEAAMCEAAVWGLLVDCGVEVEPNIDVTGKTRSPDFACRKAGEVFYVEVTCIHIETASAKTGLPDHPTPSFRFCGNLNKAIFGECQEKAAQCGFTDGPCLTAVGTFHKEASISSIQEAHVAELLTGEAMLGSDVDINRGVVVGNCYQTTHLRSAAFVKPGGREIVHARTSLSGILVCGFGASPPSVLGLLHPHPLHPFKRELLSRIPFCHLADGYQAGRLATEWI
jgi:hypothetical protein